MEIALDTSFLIFLARRRVELYRVREFFHNSIGFYTSKGVIRELKRISNSSKKIAPFAALALKLVDQYKIKIVDNNEYPDNWLLTQSVIATVDVKLLREARKRDIKVVTMTEAGRVFTR